MLVVAHCRRGSDTCHRRTVDDEIGAIENNAVNSAVDGNIDLHRALEGQSFGIGHDIDTVAFGGDGVGQYHSCRCCERRRFGQHDSQDA